MSRAAANQEPRTRNQEQPRCGSLLQLKLSTSTSKTPAVTRRGFLFSANPLAPLASWREPPIRLGECFVPDFNLQSWRSWRLGVPIKKNHAKTLRRQLELPTQHSKPNTQNCRPAAPSFNFPRKIDNRPGVGKLKKQCLPLMTTTRSS